MDLLSNKHIDMKTIGQLALAVLIILGSCKKTDEFTKDIQPAKLSLEKEFIQKFPNGFKVLDSNKVITLLPETKLIFTKKENNYLYEEIVLLHSGQNVSSGTFSFIRKSSLLTDSTDYAIHHSQSFNKKVNNPNYLNILLQKSPFDTGVTSLYSLKGVEFERMAYFSNQKIVQLPTKTQNSTQPAFRRVCFTHTSIRYNMVVNVENGVTTVVYVPFTTVTQVCTEEVGGTTTTTTNTTTTPWGGSGGSTPSTPVLYQNQPIVIAPEFLPADTTQHINLDTSFQCFTFNNTSNYQVGILVKQPVPGTNHLTSVTSWNGISSQIAPNVGHTFLSLTQIAGGKAIRRVIGFYPLGNVNPLQPTTSGVVNGNNGTHYDVSVFWNVNNTDFQNLLNWILSHQNFPYHLSFFNCTTFAVQALNSIGMNIPTSVTYWPSSNPSLPIFHGMNPGKTGEDLRSYNGPYFLKCLQQRDCGLFTNLGSCN